MSFLSSITLVLSFGYAVAVTSYATVFANTSLLLYSAAVPFSSIVYALFEFTLPLLCENGRGKFCMVTDIMTLILGILLTYGWIVSAAIWVHCKLSRTKREVCPFKDPPTQVNPLFDAARLAFPWMTVATYILHCGFKALRIRRENERRQMADGSEHAKHTVITDETQLLKDAGKSEDDLL